jgi:hypothetical protein
MKVRVEASGDQAVLDDLRRLGPAGQAAAKAVLGAVTAALVPKVQAVTPVDPEDGGQLRASVRATRPTLTSRGVVSAGIQAGGAPLKGVPGGDIYAVVQHEDVTLHHTQGGPKYVERPFFAAMPTVPDLLREALDREVAKGTA